MGFINYRLVVMVFLVKVLLLVQLLPLATFQQKVQKQIALRHLLQLTLLQFLEQHELLTVTTTAAAIAGGEKETIESIRTNAPFQYATQNRMVTPEDYTAIILRNFSTLINDICSWGGQDNPEPKFGTVFSAIDFEDDVTAATIASH